MGDVDSPGGVVSWTTVALILVVWCLVSVVSGFAFAFFFGGMNRIHPAELDRRRLEQLRRDQAKAESAPGRGTARAEARSRLSPLVVDGPSHPPLDDE